ncbi:MAG TPA: phosphotransferase [Caulobacteraceae bacterium]|nr:phosphotransferase [Caulobacteraceae bacterium]
MAEGLGLIPAERREAVRTALAAAFGARPVVGWRLLQGGVSGALIWRVEVGETSYVLRLEPERIALDHRQRGYACMSAAASAGVAPMARYADPVAGVAVIDFVDARPLSEHPGGPAGLARALGGLIARIQATPPFPLLNGEADVIAALLAGLDASGLLAPGLLDPHADGLARIRAACPLDPSSFVSSHNDPNPRNMLFDGQRVWLVDWELAFRNDPLFDIAILTTELVTTPELEALLVAAWAGRPSDPALRARLAVTRLLTRLFYGCIALEAFAGLPRSVPETSLKALTPAGFRDAVAEGRLGEGSEIAWAFGKMSLAAFIAGLAAPGFEPALALAQTPSRWDHLDGDDLR